MSLVQLRSLAGAAAELVVPTSLGCADLLQALRKAEQQTASSTDPTVEVEN